ncbi:hypothetical protein SUDANB95_03140 [Actinosynnema sp. ALI-1.44]
MVGDNRFVSEPRWRKSTFSETTGCVEVALTESRARVRNSRNTAGGELAWSRSVWVSFLRFVADR